MMIKIRQSQIEELEMLMNLYEQGRCIMRKDGNMRQWTKGYPSEELIRQDIERGNSYICINESGEVVGTFAFIHGIDPTYLNIYEGTWIDDVHPYGVIHRLTSTETSRGVATACFRWCYEQIPNLRTDTHRDNRIMQRILQQNGFRYCGIIHPTNGDERLAYQLYSTAQSETESLPCHTIL